MSNGSRSWRSLFQLGLLHVFILRLADALTVADSQLVIRVENMVTTSSLEVSGVDVNGAMSNYLRLAFSPLLIA